MFFESINPLYKLTVLPKYLTQLIEISEAFDNTKSLCNIANKIQSTFNSLPSSVTATNHLESQLQSNIERIAPFSHFDTQENLGHMSNIINQPYIFNGITKSISRYVDLSNKFNKTTNVFNTLDSNQFSFHYISSTLSESNKIHEQQKSQFERIIPSHVFDIFEKQYKWISHTQIHSITTINKIISQFKTLSKTLNKSTFLFENITQKNLILNNLLLSSPHISTLQDDLNKQIGILSPYSSLSTINIIKHNEVFQTNIYEIIDSISIEDEYGLDDETVDFLPDFGIEIIHSQCFVNGLDINDYLNFLRDIYVSSKLSKKISILYLFIIINCCIFSIAPTLLSPIFLYHLGQVISKLNINIYNARMRKIKKNNFSNYPLGIIRNDCHTIYPEPSKLSIPLFDLDAGKYIIVINKKNKNWQYVAALDSSCREDIIRYGWIECNNYDLLPKSKY